VFGGGHVDIDPPKGAFHGPIISVSVRNGRGNEETTEGRREMHVSRKYVIVGGAMPGARRRARRVTRDPRPSGGDEGRGHRPQARTRATARRAQDLPGAHMANSVEREFGGTAPPGAGSRSRRPRTGASPSDVSPRPELQAGGSQRADSEDQEATR